MLKRLYSNGALSKVVTTEGMIYLAGQFTNIDNKRLMNRSCYECINFDESCTQSYVESHLGKPRICAARNITILH
jgi:hypothetical protein